MTTAGTAIYENNCINSTKKYYVCFGISFRHSFLHSYISTSMKMVAVTSVNGVFTLQIWHPGADWLKLVQSAAE